ncbi:MAG: beta-mannosidase [Saprospiraceae bacterium]|nr:beta-mannosidase [Saprospiraceae bacterium]
MFWNNRLYKKWVIFLILLSNFNYFIIAQGISDPNATRHTKALFENLKAISGKSVLFGHQDALAYGVNWNREQDRCDVKEVTGVYPAVFGWDVGKLEKNRMYNIDSVHFEDMKRWIREAYEMGSINTISWHIDNLVSGGNSWDTTAAIRQLLPGGSHHDKLITQLDVFADFVLDLKSKDLFKHYIPIIFRPWHENTGSWFWWGKNSCTPNEYKEFWRFTVDYLRNKRNVHHLLYAYSPDPFQSKEEYMETYPGDEYVDILGLDHYFFANNNKRGDELTKKLEIITELAEEHNKISALTETGLETIPDQLWWTEALLNRINATPLSGKIAYVLVWRNAFNRKNHYYAPYSGQISAPNFVYFSRHQRVMFNDRLPNMYKMPKIKQGGLKTKGLGDSVTKR